MTAVLLAMATPALAIETSTARKYMKTSEADQMCDLSIKRDGNQPHSWKISGTCSVLSDPGVVDGSGQRYYYDKKFLYEYYRTDRLFGLNYDEASGLLQSDYMHPISVEYREIKGW